MTGKADFHSVGRIDAQLAIRFRKPLMSYFLRRVRDRAEAEDLTQEVFVRLLGAAQRQPIENPEALVFVIAGNLMKDRFHKAERRANAPLSAFEEATVSTVTREFVEDRDPERVLLGQESIAAMLAALGELGERTQDIYVLFRLENMKQKEIGALFGISSSTVEKEIMKASLHLAVRFGSGAK